ncbi:MAG: VanW family protein [Patescibacteria group bacterium]
MTKTNQEKLNTNFETEIIKLLHNYENPRRTALSKKYPKLKTLIIFLRQNLRNTKNSLDPRIKHEIKHDFFKCIIARHQSILKRKLGNSSLKLQEQKIINLRQAIKKINGIIIKPGKIFSLWNIVGKPEYKDGYVDGMLLSNGQVVKGLGGGLCQLSNFLYWIFLHAPIKTIERYHHSRDVFPDSGRTLPFGGGATILYNFIDLKIKNISTEPIQIKVWLEENHLKGKLLTPNKITEKFHVFEKNHYFIKRGKNYFRYNEIYREIKVEGKIIKTEKITTNFAPVLYKVTKAYLDKNKFKVIDLSDKKI